MAPQVSTTRGLRRKTWTEVLMAVGTPTCRSSSIGKDTTEIASATSAKTKPTPQPSRIIAQPPGVPSTWLQRRKGSTERPRPASTLWIPAATSIQTTKSAVR